MTSLPPTQDTIVAIATAVGKGAVGIVRLSGADSFRIAQKLFVPASRMRVKNLSAGRVVYGHVIDPSDGRLLDECILLAFRAPHSYTTQDVIELQTHGGIAILRRVLELSLHQGARLATPGEFTLRAYLFGRIDLLQAEAVLDLVNAQADSAQRNASLALNKSLSQALHLMQTTLTEVYGNLQVMFDYPDEGVPEAEFTVPLCHIIAEIDALLATAAAGKIVQQGARLALIGRPNAGKSSLLNALLGYHRAIVSEVPGTTRDYLEAPLELGGIPITAVDTAGIRHTDDVIEASGVARAREFAEAADLTLLLFDQSQELISDDIQLLEQVRLEHTIVILSKSDLPSVWSEVELQNIIPRSELTCLEVSVNDSASINRLTRAIQKKLIGEVDTTEVWLTNARHVALLEQVKMQLEDALTVPDDMAALHLADALTALTTLTGRGEIAEDTLAHIFANFCVGK